MTQADPQPHSLNRMPGSATSVAHVACLNCRCSVEWLMRTVCVCVRVCEWGDLWVYLLLVWFYELSVKLRQAHAHSYWDRDTQSQHCSAALCYVCWPNCLWWRQSSVNQSVAALGLWLSLSLSQSQSPTISLSASVPVSVAETRFWCWFWVWPRLCLASCPHVVLGPTVPLSVS